MSVNTLNPYVHFAGNAAEAIKLYESALGAKVEGLMHWGDMPGGKVPEQDKTRVMHAALRVNGNLLMVSDSPSVDRGHNVDIALDFGDPAEMSKGFDALASGGKVVAPISDMFWGAKFGALTDCFGVTWMLNCAIKKA